MILVRKPPFVISLGLAAALALAGCGKNRSTESSGTAPSNTGSASRVENPLSTDDSNFMMQAAQDGMAEVQYAQMARDKASSQYVKDFADRLVKDHTAANNQLQDLATKLHVTLPMALSDKQQDEKNKLAGMNSAQFEKAFMKNQVKDHEDDIKLFQDETNKGQNADLKSFASSTLPTLQNHLDMAKNWKKSPPTTSSTQ